MARLVTVFLVLAIVTCVCADPGLKRRYVEASASKGSIAIGQVSGGKFDQDSFSIGHGGNSHGKGDGGHGGNTGGNSYGGQGGDSGHTSYS